MTLESSANHLAGTATRRQVVAVDEDGWAVRTAHLKVPRLPNRLQRPPEDTHVSLDVQRIVNPGYNADRGPGSVCGVGLHWEH